MDHVAGLNPVASLQPLRRLLPFVLSAAGLWLNLTAWPLTPVAATDGKINAVICDSGTSPTITVISPTSDSVVGSPVISVRGTTTYADQVDIAVNGSPANSAPIGSSQQFDLTVTLARGTSTIRLDAVYACNQNHTTKDLVVTYEPAAAASSGAGVNTGLLSDIGRPAVDDTPDTVISLPDKSASPGAAPGGGPAAGKSLLQLAVLTGFAMVILPLQLLARISGIVIPPLFSRSLRLIGVLLLLASLGLLTLNLRGNGL